jgi:predicted N-formylglutamate amidohydrolase
MIDAAFWLLRAMFVIFLTCLMLGAILCLVFMVGKTVILSLQQKPAPTPTAPLFVTRDEVLKLLADYDTKKTAAWPSGWTDYLIMHALFRSRLSLVQDGWDSDLFSGVWVFRNFYALAVSASDSPEAVFDSYKEDLESGLSETHIYLSRQEVFSLANHSFYIPVGRGYNLSHVWDNYPGWSWAELYNPLVSHGCLRRLDPKEVSARYLPDGFIGVLISRTGRAVLDDGSIDHPARTQSWLRGRHFLWSRPGTRLRLPEHCSARGIAEWLPSDSPAVIHAPHTSLHVPSAVRQELLLSDSELLDELSAVTDAGLEDVIQHILDLPHGKRPAVVSATLSRLVFDPERFAECDIAEDVGLGAVYTKRSSGSPLRANLSPERLDWYKSQHRAYTEFCESFVSQSVKKFGCSVIIDLHSYSKDPLEHENKSLPRPELCIGVDSFHTPDWLADAVISVFSPHFEVAKNTPFSGSYVPSGLYHSDDRVFSVMLEFRRDVLETPEDALRAAQVISEFLEAIYEHLPATV